MASLSAAARLSVRAATRQLPQNAARRGFRSSPVSAAAQNFQMPALSPTMTEGNIASWKIKEGESFSAGDVLLEIETDKAQMDVEAQDDGILAKITLGDGSKAVKVGQRIGVLAEPGDDLSSLEIPAEDNVQQRPAAPKESTPSEAPKPSTPTKTSASSAAPPGQAVKQTYPLYPSVLSALRANGLTKEDADKIPATGPSGRLLKGDVLAYAGKLSESTYASDLSKILAKKAHLDLSNIKAVQPKAPAAPPAAPVAPAEPVPEPITEVTLPINFKAVLECQKRLQDTLGVYLPLSEFVARATELANEDLPRSKTAQPTADELFDAVIGLNKIPTTSRGQFIPEVSALPSLASKPAKVSQKADIFDILAGKPAKAKSAKPVATTSIAGPVNVFSVSVPKGEEKRATIFLERVKVVLETQPGELVL
ncbi:putative pyruvate dehydrogenase protein x component protein [Neofusicoccum parvum UCRNP2]|uniref:Putative pyruvate dehydrogenase protein x component protein n=1 Tax=Botryosphaeria parva (strain UCR-NP2) TaxID=1287680 RepID=R1GB09_BOTPV|nr:putative pyruvate dehydrogenase protein x component protein [Neofusicoccum parvum UCRNP2]